MRSLILAFLSFFKANRGSAGGSFLSLALSTPRLYNIISAPILHYLALTSRHIPCAELPGASLNAPPLTVLGVPGIRRVCFSY